MFSSNRDFDEFKVQSNNVAGGTGYVESGDKNDHDDLVSDYNAELDEDARGNGKRKQKFPHFNIAINMENPCFSVRILYVNVNEFRKAMGSMEIGSTSI